MLIGAGGLLAHLAAVGVAPREHTARAAAASSENPTAASEARDDPSTPTPGATAGMDLGQRLAAKGMRAGSPVMIRIFKAESQLELWVQVDDRFELFATYPICTWSGKLGPKLQEGDKQAPEGFYTVTIDQIRRTGRWPRALNIGFPNAFDKAYARTGSFILVHGGCTSKGCYAMTDPVMDEIYELTERALRQGQEAVPVHSFPFRMTEANLEANASNPWMQFWMNLKPAYDLFERTRVPPRVGICNKKYLITDGDAASRTCIDDSSDGIPMPSVESEDEGARATKTRKAASRAQSRRIAGRNARKAYAEARRARMAAHGKRMRTSEAKHRPRSH
jgi:murein L,D-transpeptidase YafK